VVVGTPVNWPSMEPIAVRLAPAMTMELDMTDSPGIFGHSGRKIRHYRADGAAAANQDSAYLVARNVFSSLARVEAVDAR